MKHPPRIGRAMGFAVLAAASLLFWWRPLANTLGLALTNEAYTHILLILPLSAALIYLDSKDQHSKNLNSKAPPIDPQPSPRIGAALLALALLIGCYARWGMSAASDDVRLSLVMFTLVTWWIASVVFCFGQRAFRSFLFPLCFLFLLVPVPGVVLNVSSDGSSTDPHWWPLCYSGQSANPSSEMGFFSLSRDWILKWQRNAAASAPVVCW